MEKPAAPHWRYPLTLWAALILTAACGQEETPVPPTAPVARVGEVQISGEELRRFALDVLPDLRPAKRGQAARQDYLQTLIDRQLMLRQARATALARASGSVAKGPRTPAPAAPLAGSSTRHTVVTLRAATRAAVALVTTASAGAARVAPPTNFTCQPPPGPAPPFSAPESPRP